MNREILGLIVLAVFVFSSNALAGEVEVTSYYPSPVGEYQNLQVSGTPVAPGTFKIRNASATKPDFEIWNMMADNVDASQRFHIGNLSWYSMGINRSDNGKFQITPGGTLNDGIKAFTYDSSNFASPTAGKIGIGIGTGNVGIGIENPTEKLDVAGTVKVTGFKMPTGAGANRVLTSDPNGVASWRPLNGGGQASTCTIEQYDGYSITQGPGGYWINCASGDVVIGAGIGSYGNTINCVKQRVVCQQAV